MAIRKIVKEGDEILRKNCRDVTAFNEKLWTLLDDMRETMLDANGVGLAAPQVGLMRRIAVVEAEGVYVELINPEITDCGGEQIGQEGCLSVPDVWGNVKRPYWIKVEFYDRNGKLQKKKYEGFLCRAVCHELDHLKGILFIDKMEK
ncbi:MAG: peptide deformylase [Christensenellales bacterium]